MNVQSTSYSPAINVAHPQTHSLRKRVAAGTGWSLCAAVFSRGASMVTWVVCARLISQQDFGVLTLLYSAVISGSTVASLSVGAAATRYVAQLRTSDPARAGRMIRMSSLVSTGTAVVFAIIIAACSRWIAAHVLRTPEHSAVVVVATVMMAVNTANAHQTGTLAGLEAFKDIARLSLWTGLSAATVTIAATLFAGMHGAVVGLTISSVITWCAYHVCLKRRCQQGGIDLRAPHWNREASVLFTFSLPAVLTSILMSPIGFITQLWLSRLPDGMTQVALYGAAERWRLIILFVPGSMFQAALPILSHVAAEGSRRLFQKVVKDNLIAALGLVTLMALTCSMFAPSAMTVFGHSYQTGSSVLILLCLATLPQVVNGVLGQAIVVRSMWTRLAFDLLLFAVLLASAFVLIPRFGASGVATAYLVAFSLVTPLMFLYSKRQQLV